MKKSPQKALVFSLEEYVSGGEEDDDEEESEEVGMAALAMGKLPPSLAPLFITQRQQEIQANVSNG